MLWCAVCCEPYHPFCLDPDDLPLCWDGTFGKNFQDWICRRCSICQICGLPGDLGRADKANELENSKQGEYSSSDESDVDTKAKKRRKLSKKRQKQLKRERLRCRGCGGAFHSDCLQPSQQKMIKSQGSQWVSGPD